MTGHKTRQAVQETQARTSAPRPDGPRLPARVERRIRIARAILVWEALWPALWPPVGLGGLFLVLALFNAFAGLPMGLHWALLAGFGGLTAWMLWRGLKSFRWPDREAALRHLELVSGLTHQPLAAYEDVAAPGTGDAALWRAHQHWVAERIRRLKLGFASPGLAERDPYALRAAVVLLLLVAFLGTGNGQMSRIAAALLPGLGAARSFSVEAWITPPAYTGQAPIYLEQAKDTEAASEEKKLIVPENSVLSLRVHGLKAAPALEAGQGDRGRPEPLKDMGDMNYTIDAPIKASTEFTLTQGGRMMRGWNIDVVADRRPAIELTKPLEKTSSGTLRFAYKVEDDYGVTSAEARIVLVRPPVRTPADTRPGARAEAAVLPSVTPPTVNLPLPTLRPKDAKGETYIDLTPHPWAGLPVMVTLVAKDDAGQEGTAPPVALILPARDFKKPLAAAIVEQRRALALDPASTARVARVLDDLTVDADRYIDDLSVYLALRAAYWRLTSARHDGDLTGIFDLLWSTALHIEDGDLSLAENDVRRARDALTEALAKGASGDEINRLMSELKDAFKRYMDALAARGDMQPNPLERFAPQDGQTIDRSDLERMLSAIDELAKSGARDQAKAMLQQLQAIMENMRVPQQSPGMTPQEQAMSQGVDRMGKLIDKQRQLMDETFRKGGSQGSAGSGQQGGAPGEKGQGGKQGNPSSLHDLKRAQSALREELAQVMRDLEKSGAKLPPALGKAGDAMKSAEDRLGDGRADRATASQGQAIANMREGAQGLADQLMQSMAGRRGNSGQGRASDPFGRSLPNAGPDLGNDVAVPDKIDIQRAREIIQELRRRAGELGRPKIELDYLDRLLKRF
ncbi:TIGR02302 family protein [Parvibaculum sp.]|uniref:TIGR02302 family protein n=1 Tax=Parvibaculum sp. TaxID=2024848 RepID=UPI002CE66FD2|nr:TIGR02302 family protein [Parvibaculum sp.]HUD52924.1 TIGR02302 family protein [Parvibaculum sp.]